jgi:hypothetical protein
LISLFLCQCKINFYHRFKTFEFYRNELINVFDLWDRTKGVTRSPPTPTNQSEEDHSSGALAGGAGVKKTIPKKDKSKNRTRSIELL